MTKKQIEAFHEIARLADGLHWRHIYAECETSGSKGKVVPCHCGAAEHNATVDKIIELAKGQA